MNLLKQFLTYQAQTTPHPLALEIRKARGCFLYDNQGKRYLDFVAGVSACNLGHRHPRISRAISRQLQKYSHVMVYGEFIQKPQLLFSKKLSQLLPQKLNTVYPTNSGAEAIEGSMKLAKRYTGRSKLIACLGAYHGSTQGALSIMGNEIYKQAYRPLLPHTDFIIFNNLETLDKIDKKTAAVFIETIQGAAGFNLPTAHFLKVLSQRCQEAGALLVFDEIQPGFGRTGKLFAFEHYGVVPDILVVGKAMANGLPCGAFIADNPIMAALKTHPKLGHITTFGGHPVIAAAAYQTLCELEKSDILDGIANKERLFRKLLVHPKIIEVRGKGLMLSVVFESPALAENVLKKALQKGLLLFFVLFKPNMLRITPPLTITAEQIQRGCALLKRAIDESL